MKFIDRVKVLKPDDKGIRYYSNKAFFMEDDDNNEISVKPSLRMIYEGKGVNIPHVDLVNQPNDINYYFIIPNGEILALSNCHEFLNRLDNTNSFNYNEKEEVFLIKEKIIKNTSGDNSNTILADLYVDLNLLIKMTNSIMSKYSNNYMHPFQVVDKFIPQIVEEFYEYVEATELFNFEENREESLMELVDIILYLGSLAGELLSKSKRSISEVYTDIYKKRHVNLQSNHLTISINNADGKFEIPQRFNKGMISEIEHFNLRGLIISLGRIRRLYPQRKYHKPLTHRELVDSLNSTDEDILDDVLVLLNEMALMVGYEYMKRYLINSGLWTPLNYSYSIMDLNDKIKTKSNKVDPKKKGS